MAAYFGEYLGKTIMQLMLAQANAVKNEILAILSQLKEAPERIAFY
jgi:uncharacterized protein (DUF2336 family)